MTSTLSLIAPAKINLSLRILGKRADGYHEVETLMAPVLLADEIALTLTPATEHGTVSFFCNDPTLPSNGDNLCVKAAHAFYEASGLSDPIRITLVKKVPHGAGLGGGSSDAAAILRGMNELFKEPITFEELYQLASSLGSDVPFFLDPKPRYCHGRGEILGETVALPSWKLLLIKPPFPIASAEAYGRLQATDYRLQDDAISLDGVSIFNNLETPVFKKYLQLPVLKSWLQARPEVVATWMTGSGSTMVTALRKETPSTAIATLKKDIAAELGETIWIAETSLCSCSLQPLACSP